jgi:hypothetical protein
LRPCSISRSLIAFSASALSSNDRISGSFTLEVR